MITCQQLAELQQLGFDVTIDNRRVIPKPIDQGIRDYFLEELVDLSVNTFQEYCPDVDEQWECADEIITIWGTLTLLALKIRYIAIGYYGEYRNRDNSDGRDGDETFQFEELVIVNTDSDDNTFEKPIRGYMHLDSALGKIPEEKIENQRFLGKIGDNPDDHDLLHI